MNQRYINAAKFAYRNRKYIKQGYIMLRGTVAKKRKYALLNTRPSLQNQIASLRRKVNEQKPETKHFIEGGNFTSSVPTNWQETYNITQNLINDTNFRDNINGDTWKNLSLKVNLKISDTCEIARVLVYVPKKVGVRFIPSSYITALPADPNLFWVIADYYVQKVDRAEPHGSMRVFSLKGLKTVYDSLRTQIDKGEVMLTVIGTGTSSTLQYTIGTQLTYHDL